MKLKLSVSRKAKSLEKSTSQCTGRESSAAPREKKASIESFDREQFPDEDPDEVEDAGDDEYEPHPNRP